MNTAAHTPGPWEVAEGDSTTLHIDDAFGLDGGRNYYLADVRHGDPEELAANARLIAAAPDLLAALLAIVKEAGSQFGNDDGPGSVNRMAYFARAAIAKATGSK